MLHKFKFASRRFAYDSGSDSLHTLDELGYKMLDYLVLPMAPDCPSALRYDLAKYDSETISETYLEMLALWKDGKLFSSDADFDVTEPEKMHSGAALTETDAGLVIAPTDEELADLDEELKELDRRIKSALKSDSGSIFAPVTLTAPTFDCCKDCFARRFCSLTAPGAQLCKLERKRVECELACK